jgi:hypothetical protein
MLSSQSLLTLPPFKIILSNTNNMTTENLMAFFVDCILQQYLNFKKRITTVPPHQEDIALFFKIRQQT